MRRTGLPQQTTPGKVLGDHAGRLRLLEFRKPAIRKPKEMLSSAGSVAVSAGATERMNWAFTLEGPDLIDTSGDDTSPKIKTAGIYAFAVAVEPDENLTVGAPYDALLRVLIPSAVWPVIHQLSSPAITAARRPGVALAFTSYMPRLTEIQVEVQNFDSVSRDFTLVQATIQRVT